MKTDHSNRPIIFFDGECNLCNRAIQFVIRHDKKGQFLFAPLQSSAGKTAIESLKKSGGHYTDSIIFFYKGKYSTKSAAALDILRIIGGVWKLAYTGIIIPAFIRDKLYDIIARNRYKWFGKRKECMVPTPELMQRFLFSETRQ